MGPLITFGAIWLGLRLFAGRAFEWGLKALSAVFHWLMEEPWRAIALGALILYAWSTLVTLPTARREAAEWQLAAGENLNAFYAEQAAHAQSIENIRTASAAAEAEAKARAQRIEARQRAINEETQRDFENRLAALRARYDQLDRLRRAGSPPEGERAGARRADAADLPGAPAFPARADEAAGDTRLPQPAPGSGPGSGPGACPTALICLTLEQAWIASVQAVQLDALITAIEARQKADQEPAQ